MHLVNRQDRKIQRILLCQPVVPVNGMRLHPQFQTPANPDPVPVFLLQVGNLRKVPGIVHIRKRLPVPPPDFLPAVPVHLDPVIHVVRETDLLQPQANGVPHHILHGIHRVIRKLAMHMIIRQHSRSLRFPSSLLLSGETKHLRRTPRQIRTLFRPDTRRQHRIPRHRMTHRPPTDHRSPHCRCWHPRAFLLPMMATRPTRCPLPTISGPTPASPPREPRCPKTKREPPGPIPPGFP